MHKAHSVYHFLPQHSAVKSARYRPPGFTRNSPPTQQQQQPKRAISAPGLQLQSRSRRQQAHVQANAASSANVSASASAGSYIYMFWCGLAVVRLVLSEMEVGGVSRFVESVVCQYCDDFFSSLCLT